MTIEVVKRNTTLLWGLMVPAAAYLAWQYYAPWSLGDDLANGMAGVLLGLFICSRPAANGIDLFFMERGMFRRMIRGNGGFGWFLLNGMMMVVGWFVISVGAARLTAQPQNASNNSRTAGPQYYSEPISIAAPAEPVSVEPVAVPDTR